MPWRHRHLRHSRLYLEPRRWLKVATVSWALGLMSYPSREWADLFPKAGQRFLSAAGHQPNEPKPTTTRSVLRRGGQQRRR